MRICTRLRQDAPTGRWPGTASLIGVLLIALGGLPLQEAAGQRPFRVYDPFYRSETARRAFYDGIAVTGEVSYRAAGSVQNNGLPTSNPDPFGLSVRLDYQLAPRLDLNAFWDATGTNTGRTLVVSWVGLKYYWTVENSDYAFRLAVDPSSDGRIGFPQMDLAFLSTRALSPVFSNDIALGVRHVRMGFQQFVPADRTGNGEPAFLNTHALGLELHFMWTYNVIFDPASSNIFLSFVGEGGQYSLFASPLFQGPTPVRPSPGTDETGFSKDHYRGGVIWARSGIEYNRPSYQFIPFLGVPLKQWRPRSDNWHDARLNFGFRLMLR